MKIETDNSWIVYQSISLAVSFLLFIDCMHEGNKKSTSQSPSSMSTPLLCNILHLNTQIFIFINDSVLKFDMNKKLQKTVHIKYISSRLRTSNKSSGCAESMCVSIPQTNQLCRMMFNIAWFREIVQILKNWWHFSLIVFTELMLHNSRAAPIRLCKKTCSITISSCFMIFSQQKRPGKFPRPRDNCVNIRHIQGVSTALGGFHKQKWMFLIYIKLRHCHGEIKRRYILLFFLGNFFKKFFIFHALPT